MSRTDAHEPWLVWIKDPYNRHLIRHHDPIHEWNVAVYVGTCGCRMCTDHWGRHYSTRSERVAWRNLRSQLLQAHDIYEVDVPRTMRRERYWWRMTGTFGVKYPMKEQEQ